MLQNYGRERILFSQLYTVIASLFGPWGEFLDQIVEMTISRPEIVSTASVYSITGSNVVYRNVGT